MRKPWIASAAVLLSLGGCAFEQLQPPCVVGRGGHAVRYTLKSGTGACAQKKAEIVGVQKYNPPGQEQTVALQPDTLYQYKEQAPTNATISLGRLVDAEPGEDGYCPVENMSVGQVTLGPAGGPPEVDIRYAWKDVRFHVSAAAPGTQWMATLDYTEGSCTATYEAVGVYPAITCQVRNEDGDFEVNPDGSPKVDPTLCAQADPYLFLALDPSFPVTCDPVSALCLLEGTPPSFKQ